MTRATSSLSRGSEGRAVLAVATVATVGAGAEVVFYALAGRWLAAAGCGYLVLLGIASGWLLFVPPAVPWGVSTEPPGQSQDQGERDGKLDELVIQR